MRSSAKPLLHCTAFRTATTTAVQKRHCAMVHYYVMYCKIARLCHAVHHALAWRIQKQNNSMQCSAIQHKLQHNAVQIDKTRIGTVQHTIGYTATQRALCIYYYHAAINTLYYTTVQINPLPCNTVQHNTMQFNTSQYSTIQCITIHLTTLQYTSIQYTSIQYPAIHCYALSTLEYTAIHLQYNIHNIQTQCNTTP